MSFTTSWSSFRLQSTELLMLSNHLIFCLPLLLLPSIFPGISSFPMSGSSHQWPKYWSFSLSISPYNVQDWFPLGWTGWICCSPKDSQESSPAPQFESINASVYITLKLTPCTHNIPDYILRARFLKCDHGNERFAFPIIKIFVM